MHFREFVEGECRLTLICPITPVQSGQETVIAGKRLAGYYAPAQDGVRWWGRRALGPGENSKKAGPYHVWDAE